MSKHSPYLLNARKRLIVAAISACFASAPAWGNPTGPQVVNGMASISQAGKLLTVSNSNGAIINWNTFSIGADETTRFNQASASSSVLNRVLANDPSVLLGTLSSNGRVWLVNPSGIMVGQGAKIDVGGFVASTLNVRNEDFLAGRLNFGATPNAGSIQNHGRISTPSGGSVYLIAPEVTNHGIINAPNGEVLLAAGQTVQLLDTGTPGVKVEITGAEGKATNLGEIVAEAGRIGMAGVLVKNGGTLNASSVVKDGGRIFLKASQRIETLETGRLLADGTKGGEIIAKTEDNGRIAGELVARGEISARGNGSKGSGGFIETSAAKVTIGDDLRIDTGGGEWLIDPADFTIASGKAGMVTGGTPSGDISGSTLSTALGTGNVTILSSQGSTASGSGDINVEDAVSWSANTLLTLTAARDINLKAVVTASGSAALTMNANGAVKAKLGASGFIGRVDFPSRSGTGFLTINGSGYTVINSLGSASSTTGTDLQGMRGGLSGNYALGSNIDASGTNSWNGNAGFMPVGDSSTNFTGAFDGLGHTITGLTINRPTTRYVGLFGYTNGATLRNVGLVLGSVTGQHSIGSLTGGNSASSISNSYNTGMVTGSGSDPGGFVGGLAGWIDSYSSINNSYNTGTVSGSR
ncbi:MAG: filamentous hemagglutinin N-terminal domain-containing protein, partial [Pseudomonadota bacterium]